MSIEKLPVHYSMQNLPTIYDEEALTALELAARTTGKLNEVVEGQNKLVEDTENHLKEQDSTIKTMNDVTMPAKVTAEVKRHINSGTFTDEINDFLGGLNERVDSLTQTLTPGSTTGDAELVDMRTSTDGTTYENAGKALRGQVDDLRPHADKENLIKDNDLLAGFLLNDGNRNYGHGQSEYGRRFEFCTALIPIDPQETYHFQLNPTGTMYSEPWVGFNMYNAEGTNLGRIAFTQENVKVRFAEHNVNTVGVRISYRGYMMCRPKFEVGGYASKLDGPRTSATLEDMFEGYMLSDGQVTDPTVSPFDHMERTTPFIAVNEGETYHIINMSLGNVWSAVMFHDANGIMLGNGRVTNTTQSYKMVAPAGAKYMRVSARTYLCEAFGVFNVNDPSPVYSTYKRRLMERRGNCNVKSIAHRGGVGVAPENTLPGYRAAKNAGFDIVEADVRFTQDRVPVILHDVSIDRTSNGTGNISALTFEAVRSLDFGAWYDPKYTWTKIPTLDEFIRLCRDIGLHAYIELKEAGEANIQPIIHSVKCNGMLRNVTWISFGAGALATVRDIDPKARLGYTVDYITEETVAAAVALRNGENEVFLNAHHGQATNENVDLCIHANLPLEVWTVNNEATVPTLHPYISGVTSDTVHAGDVLFNNEIGG